MLLQDLENRNLIRPPKWLSTNTAYLCLMGSVAYGVSSDTSDSDIYGFAIPPKGVVFPHLLGEIQGFGRHQTRFEQWSEHHITDPSAGKEYDFAIYNIVKFFMLAMENNPNMVDALFVPLNCVIHSTAVGNLVRENRRIFLHKGSYHKFLGYAHSSLHKALGKEHKGAKAVEEFEKENGIPHTTTFAEVEKELASRAPYSSLSHLTADELSAYKVLYTEMIRHSGRAERAKVQGADFKFLYHVVRLADECEQILTTGDLDLQRAREHMKAVRRGEISETQIREWFAVREKTLEKMYAESKLPHAPDEERIKALLLQCLEAHYGSLDKCIVNPDAATNALKDIRAILDRLPADLI